jgi:EAL domain-containing protein (putative c-di-GMP-specific phosphodiesterase class I)
MDRALRTWVVPPDRLVIQIDESAFAGGIEHMKETLTRLKALGLQLAIDSFGTGSSSVSNLAQLPLDEMKLTAALVSDMRRVPLHAKVVRTLVQLAQNLGLRMTAEGVEDAETALALSTLGCERVQGGYVGPPIGALDVLARCGKNAIEPQINTDERR